MAFLSVCFVLWIFLHTGRSTLLALFTLLKCANKATASGRDMGEESRPTGYQRTEPEARPLCAFSGCFSNLFCVKERGLPVSALIPDGASGGGCLSLIFCSAEPCRDCATTSLKSILSTKEMKLYLNTPNGLSDEAPSASISLTQEPL